MHKYNNQGHSVMTSILAVENVINNTAYDRWRVNIDAKYHEDEKYFKERKITLNSLRFVPRKEK